MNEIKTNKRERESSDCSVSLEIHMYLQYYTLYSIFVIQNYEPGSTSRGGFIISGLYVHVFGNAYVYY